MSRAYKGCRKYLIKLNGKIISKRTKPKKSCILKIFHNKIGTFKVIDTFFTKRQAMHMVQFKNNAIFIDWCAYNKINNSTYVAEFNFTPRQQQIAIIKRQQQLTLDTIA